MREDQYKFLLLNRQLPARLTVDQVAWMLNCQVHDVPLLIAARLLKPLGNPAPNGIKFFATVEINELCKDRAWLSKATQAVNLHWRNQNLKKRGRAALVVQQREPLMDDTTLASN